MNRILVLDDDPIFLALVQTSLNDREFEVQVFSKATEALVSLKNNEYNLIISDLIMPEMNGEVFYEKAREIDRHIPFVFLTADTDIDTAVHIIQTGADDYICKPIKGLELRNRIANVLSNKKQEEFIKQTLLDHELENREKEGIISWKHLYGMKDLDQTNKIMNYLSRNIEQGGGFTFIDLLKNEIKGVEEKQILIDKSLLDLIIASSENIRTIISDLHSVTKFLDETLSLEKIPLYKFVENTIGFIYEQIIPLVISHNRKVSLNVMDYKNQADLIKVHSEKFFQVLHELTCNAVKYSPKNSKIFFNINLREQTKDTALEISIWNSPVTTVSQDEKGDQISGIPYEYSESVFELFRTFEKFPVQIEEEQWKHGTGLFFVRKMLEKMNGNVEAHNIVMHSLPQKQPYVSVSVTLPLYET